MTQKTVIGVIHYVIHREYSAGGQHVRKYDTQGGQVRTE